MPITMKVFIKENQEEIDERIDRDYGFIPFNNEEREALIKCDTGLLAFAETKGVPIAV